MAIYFQAFSHDIIAKFKEIILPALTDQQKKICLVVSLAFSLLAVCYVVKRYCFKVQISEEENVKDNATPIFHSKEQPKTPSHATSPHLSSLKPQEILKEPDAIIEEEEIFEATQLNQEFELQETDKQENHSIEILPEDLLVNIFKQLDFENWKTLSFINKNFNKLSLIPTVATSLLEKNLIPRTPNNKKIILKCIESAAFCLNKLDLEKMELSEEEVKKIFSLCPNLKELNLTYTKFSDTAINGILRYLPPHLNSLNLTGCDITDQSLLFLKKFNALQSLNLSACRITDDGLLHLKTLTALQSLNLIACSGITNDGLLHLKTLNALQSLMLSGCFDITDDGLVHLKTLNALQSLNLGRCGKITDNGLQHLQTLTALQFLNLKECQITDNGLQYLKALTALQSLNLSGCKNIIYGLEHLQALTALQSLNLDGCDRLILTNFKDFKKALPLCIVKNYT